MSRPKVFLTRMIPQAGINLLAARCELEINPQDRPLSKADLLERVRGRDAVLCILTDRIDADVMAAAAPTCRIFANLAVGYDNIDVAAARSHGIRVSNTPGVLTEDTAEMAWALIFAACRRIVEADRFMRTGQWIGWGPLQFLGQGISGKTLGLVGAGRIGSEVARMSAGFRMKIVYCDEHPNERIEQELGAQRTDLETVLRTSDIVSLHCPLTPQTRHLIGAAQLAMMKRTAVLVNTSRGPVIEEDDLVAALRNGVIAAAGLDVYEQEPRMAAGLADLPNVVVCPHIASATYHTRSQMAIIAARNILAVLEGKEPESPVA